MDRLSKCEDITGILVLYHYGELTPVKAAAVEAHLAGCEACAAELAAMRRALGLVAPDMPSPAEAARLRANVMRRIAAPRKSPFLRFVPAMAGAALVAVVALLFNYAGPLTPGGEKRGAGQAELAVDVELLENYELVANLDMLEEMDTLEDMEEL